MLMFVVWLYTPCALELKRSDEKWICIFKAFPSFLLNIGFANRSRWVVCHISVIFWIRQSNPTFILKCRIENVLNFGGTFPTSSVLLKCETRMLFRRGGRWTKHNNAELLFKAHTKICLQKFCFNQIHLIKEIHFVKSRIS